MHRLPSRVVLHTVPCLRGVCVPPLGKTRSVRSSAGMLHAMDALQCGSFHAAACGHFQSLRPCCIAFWSTLRRSDLSFMLSIYPQTITLTLMGCSTVSAVSPEQCLIVGILEKCLLLAPIPRPAHILDKRCATRASPFCSAWLIYSASTRFRSFSLFCHAWIDRETPNLFGQPVVYPAFLLGAPIFMVARLLLFASSLSSPLFFNF